MCRMRQSPRAGKREEISVPVYLKGFSEKRWEGWEMLVQKGRRSDFCGPIDLCFNTISDLPAVLDVHTFGGRGSP
jgi:hypothetical protein